MAERKFRMYVISVDAKPRSVDFPGEYTEAEIFKNLEARKFVNYEIREVISEERVVQVKTVRSLV